MSSAVLSKSPSTHELSVEEIRVHAEEAADACERSAPADQTPPEGMSTKPALDLMIKTAGARAKTPDELRRVKEAREAFFAYERDPSTYRIVGEKVKALADLLMKAPTDARPGTVPQPQGPMLVASKSQRGAWWCVENDRCQCKAGASGMLCHHVREVRAGEGRSFPMPPIAKATSSNHYPRNVEEAFDRAARSRR